MEALTQVLQSVITRKYKFCCLCLKVINENTVNIHDEVILKEDDNESPIKMFDVLTDILGFDVSIFYILLVFFLFILTNSATLHCPYFFMNWLFFQIFLNSSLVLTITNTKKKYNRCITFQVICVHTFQIYIFV